MSIVAGIDYSMSCPAICVYDTKKEFRFENCSFFFYNTKTKFNKSFNNIHGFIHLPFESAQERYDNISEWAMMVLKKNKVSKVCIEGYSFASKSSSMTAIAENCGLLKYKIWKEGIEIVTIPPTSVKLKFSGKGNAKKEMMHQTIVEKYNMNVSKLLDSKESDSPVSDVVDSFAIVYCMISAI